MPKSEFKNLIRSGCKGVYFIFHSISLSILFASCVLVRKPHTPAIKSQDGHVSVAKLEFITLGRLKQAVLSRSKDIKNPVLLFLHGGPGMPIMYLGHKFQRPLENDFVVVQWDHRGAGKSFTDTIPVESINVEQYIADALQLIDTIRKRYPGNKIYLAAHSWGTYLGSILASRHPELFEAYISIGQITDGKKAEPIQRKFLLEEAKMRGDKKAIADIEKYGKRRFEKYLFRYGAELKDAKSMFPLIWTGLGAKEYSFKDARNVSKGPQFCNRYMQYNAISGSIMENIREYGLPVYFIVGKRDYVTPGELIQEYVEQIKAPSKELIWFTNSAHFPFFEEPEAFNLILKTIKGDDAKNNSGH